MTDFHDSFFPWLPQADDGLTLRERCADWPRHGHRWSMAPKDIIGCGDILPPVVSPNGRLTYVRSKPVVKGSKFIWRGEPRRYAELAPRPDTSVVKIDRDIWGTMGYWLLASWPTPSPRPRTYSNGCSS